MQFHPDFSVTGVVIAVSPRTAGIKVRYTEEGHTYEPWYKLSSFAHRSLPKVGSRVELSVSERNGTSVNSWIDLDAPAVPYKLEPAVGEDIPFEVEA